MDGTFVTYMKIREKLACLGIVLLALIFTVVLPANGDEKSLGLTETRLLKPGTVAPSFTLKTLDNREYTLKDHMGKNPVLLFFWSFFCGPCREEIPVLEEVYAAFGKEKLEYVGVNLDGKRLSKAITRYIEDSSFKFTAVFDELNGLEYLVADPYGIAGTPTLYVIDTKGKIFFSAVGDVEHQELVSIIEKAR